MKPGDLVYVKWGPSTLWSGRAASSFPIGEMRGGEVGVVIGTSRERWDWTVVLISSGMLGYVSSTLLEKVVVVP